MNEILIGLFSFFSIFFGTFAFVFCFYIILGFIRAFVFHKMWIWFVVPILHVPEIDITKIFLLIFAFSFLLTSVPKEKKYYISGFLNCVSILFLGYILKIIFSGSLI